MATIRHLVAGTSTLVCLAGLGLAIIAPQSNLDSIIINRLTISGIVLGLVGFLVLNIAIRISCGGPPELEEQVCCNPAMKPSTFDIGTSQ